MCAHRHRSFYGAAPSMGPLAGAAMRSVFPAVHTDPQADCGVSLTSERRRCPHSDSSY